ncbi:MAG: antibiotic biosynthesis monooxygenase [Myxococcota bacterium]
MGGSMLIVHVHIDVKPECVEEFIQATAANAHNSLKEQGIARFDLIQSHDEPTHFILMEAYRTAEAPTEHKETEHYHTWVDTVEHMMAGPRRVAKYSNSVPDDSGWD